MRDLLEIRNEIDTIDQEIVRLYEERMKKAEQVADYKISTGKSVYDPVREKEKLDSLSAMASTPFNGCGIRELFQQIMSGSRKRQYQLLSEHGIMEPFGFNLMDEIDMSSGKVVFQGAQGAYTQQAVMSFFGMNCDSYHVDTWREAMEAISNGDAAFAVLPIENSSAGAVSENYDLLVEYDNTIVGEQIIQIRHALLGTEDATMEDIKEVYSHPQALMQCEQYLKGHSNWGQLRVLNTAIAAMKIRDDKDKTHAAIAGVGNAKIYGLKILEDSIQDNKENYTRFIVVSHRHVYTPKSNKISICFEAPHESGSLYHMLSHFIYNNLNMSSIQSRPIREEAWEYRFFVDFEGNLEDSAVQNALRGLKEEATSLKILGNYPSENSNGWR